jgi:DHA2 family methylenomycin A resistance protein-like MFS transporter
MTAPNPRRTLFAASLGFFVVILDTTIVNLALPAIGEDLGASLSELQWVIDGYVVVFASLLLSSGALSDRIGAARCYAGGMIAFTTASVACGAAPTLGVLLVARVLQGAAAALLLPSSLALVRLAYDAPRERARGIAVWAAAGGVAIAAGPVLGGLLTSGVDWRAIFLLNVPVGAIAVIATVHGPRTPPLRTPLDLPGQIAAILGVGALTLAVIEAGHRGIGSGPALAAAAVFIASAVAFVVIERRSAHPAVPFDLFRAPVVGATITSGLIFNFAFYGQLFLLSLFFQGVLGHSALEAGLMFLPLTALIALANIYSGRWTSLSGPRRPLIAGELLLIAGFAALIGIDAESPTVLILAALTPIGIGGGLAIPPLTAALLEALPAERSGLASGVLNAARQFGGGLGVALFGGLVGGEFVAGMHEALAIGVATLLVTVPLTLAYVDPPGKPAAAEAID